VHQPLEKESKMRKVLMSAVLAASTLAMAAPAAAQYGQPQYGNAYGRTNNYGQVRSLMVRINNLQRQISQLDRRNIVSDREANRLQSQANQIERQLSRASRNGLNSYEARDIQLRIARLEQNIRHQATDGNRYVNRNAGYVDRDRDGRNDRYEDDRGTRHD
jgi:TolA-binding protein